MNCDRSRVVCTFSSVNDKEAVASYHVALCRAKAGKSHNIRETNKWNIKYSISIKYKEIIVIKFCYVCFVVDLLSEGK